MAKTAVRSRIPVVCAVTCALLSGCASVSLRSVGVAPATAVDAQYHAFGDSITHGAELADPATQAYPALVAVQNAVTLANHAISGSQACDIAPGQLFGPGVGVDTPSHTINSVLIGTNDVDMRGVGPYEAVFNQCHQAVLAWLAVPAASKIIAGGKGVSTTGPGALDKSHGWSAWTTQGQGATVSFTFATAQAGAVYAWQVIDDGSAATYTYALDSVQLGSTAAHLSPNIATALNITRSVGFLRLPNVPAGQHTLTFTQTNLGMDGVSVLAVGVPMPASGVPLPTVLVGTIPFQKHTGDDIGCQRSDAPCQQYNADIEANVSLFASDGLDLRLFDTRQYMKGTSSEMADSLHPNGKGQKELSQAVQSVWNAQQ